MNVITDTLRTMVASRPIGSILIDQGRLSAESAERIVALQMEKSLRFGDAAIQLGLLTEGDIQIALAQQFEFPYLQPGDERVSEEVIAAFKPFTPIAEQLRALRSQLRLRWFDQESGRKTIAVVSAGNGEGRSFVAANLAVVFAQLGEHTLLLDADLRNPRQHELFRLDNRVGLTSALAGRAHLQEAAARISGLPGLTVLRAGPTPPNPQELLGRPVFKAMMAFARKKYDIVIVDTPDGSATADVQTIAASAHGVIVVARKDVTAVGRLQALVSSLQQSGVPVVGSVLNNG
jgi:protein-tyrosine kinase